MSIVVDLDGTLVETDTLYESLMVAVHDWRTVLSLPLWLFSGKSRFKARLAGRCPPDIRSLPFNHRLLNYLAEQKGLGRRLILVTGAHRSVAESINHHLGIFDEVVGSDGSCNLRGRAKAKALAERFGSERFCYIGNDRTDLHVWKRSSSGVLVNASRRLAKAASVHTMVEGIIERTASERSALIKAMRPHQWLKNLLVFAPIITSNGLEDLSAWRRAAMTFLAFCLVASATYLINDLFDLGADRSHPTKRNRPFASGALAVRTGLLLAPLLMAAGLAAGGMVEVGLFLTAYALVSIGYSMKLKEFALVDLFALAFLYTLRLFAGGVATGYRVSLWLLAFSGFLFFSLAAVKRIAELVSRQQAGERVLSRRGYLPGDLAPLQAMGISSSFASSLVMALYVQSQTASGRFASHEMLWGLVPLFLFWQCRLWLLSSRGSIREDPVIYTVRDRGSWAVALLMGVAFVLANLRLA